MKKIMFSSRFGLEQDVIEGRKNVTRREIPLPLTADRKEIVSAEMGVDRKGRTIATFYGYNMEGRYRLFDVVPYYQIGEEVAIAQSYSTLEAVLAAREYKRTDKRYDNYYRARQFGRITDTDYGWNNKMYVKSEYMPYHIRIKDIGIEQLMDITDEDCRKEGIIPVTFKQYHKQAWDDHSPQKITNHELWTLEKFRKGIEDPWADNDPDEIIAKDAKTAFVVLMAKLSHKRPDALSKRNPWMFTYALERVY